LGYTLDFVIPPLEGGGREEGREGGRGGLPIVLEVDGPFHFLAPEGGGGRGRGREGGKEGGRALGPTRLKHRVLRCLCEGRREGGTVWGGFVSISSREWEKAGREGGGEKAGEERRRRSVARKLEEEGIDPRVFFAWCEEGGREGGRE